MLPHFRPKSFTGNHILVPDDEGSSSRFIHPTSLTDVSPWKVGSGTVIWRIWPAVLLHTCFAAAVVSVSHESGHNLAISSVMITVVGVVLGFVISYRASSGYDRYWQGRCLWSDVIKTCRTFSRLVWIHVPSRLQAGKDHKPEESESKRAIAEKKAALKLIEGFTVALKHHLRGENGVYYADLYPLLRPLHIRRSASKSSLTCIFRSSELSEPLGYLAIFAVAVAAFLFLGFLAAGEEIEQPFGYDENDLDLDVFIREIIHADVLSLMRITAPNSSIPTGKEDNLGHGLIADASLMDVSGSNQTDPLGSTE
ncbi:hypothetical protein FRC02_007772 [Tulasnella sp. 418]|nr:hypothetical protein FRC02_007772 [Tulasnella sp. 418]